MTEVFKFSKNSDCSLRSDIHLENLDMHTVHSIGNLGAKVWKHILENVKTSETINIFKKHIKSFCQKFALVKMRPFNICLHSNWSRLSKMRLLAEVYRIKKMLLQISFRK